MLSGKNVEKEKEHHRYTCYEIVLITITLLPVIQSLFETEEEQKSLKNLIKPSVYLLFVKNIRRQRT